MNDTKLIAIYGRVSTLNQENEGTIETQLLAVRNYAKDHGYIIVEEYLDEGWSGDFLMRPALDQLRIDAKNKKWEAVLTYDPDRLARRGAWQEVVIEELKELEIDVLFVTIPQAKTDEDKIMQKMRGVFTEYERMKIKERFRLGKLRKVKEGHLLVSEPLYGYTYIKMKDDVHGYYVINEDEARVVRMIFKWIDEEGLTQLKIIKRLQELGIKPRRSKRGFWSTSTLTTMLRNRAYIGQAHWGTTYATVPLNPTNKEKYRKIKKSSRRIKPEEEWIATNIPVPPIIDEALFNRVRDRINTNAFNNKRNTKNEYMLTGVIYCTCGRRRCGEGAQKGKHLYYRCTDRIHMYPLPKQCEQQGINAKIIDNLVWDKVSSLMSSPALLTKQVTRWLSSKQTKNVFNVGDTAKMEKEIEKLKTEEDRYSKAYGAGVLTIEQLKDCLDPIRDKKLALEIQIQKAKTEEREISSIEIPNSNQIEEFALKARDAISNLSFSAKKGIIMNVIEKIISGNNQLQICGYIPITNENTNVAFISSYRNCWVTKRREIDPF